MDLQLAGKTVLITGGSKGIGGQPPKCWLRKAAT